MNISTITLGACAGIVATMTMDLAASLFGKLGLARGAKGRWMGRWYLGLSHGHLAHEDITLSPPRSGEERAAWIGHYLIGVALAVLYFVGAVWLGFTPTSVVVALAYGLATCIFPWFLVFPALGFGVLGRKGPAELRLIRTSLLNHLSYGFGLWWTALALAAR